MLRNSQPCWGRDLSWRPWEFYFSLPSSPLTSSTSAARGSHLHGLVLCLSLSALTSSPQELPLCIAPARSRPPCPSCPGTAHLPQDRFVRNTLLSYLSISILGSLCYSTLATIPANTLISTSLSNASPQLGHFESASWESKVLSWWWGRGSQTSSSSSVLTWELTRHANPQTPPQTYWMRTRGRGSAISLNKPFLHLIQLHTDVWEPLCWGMKKKMKKASVKEFTVERKRCK